MKKKAFALLLAFSFAAGLLAGCHGRYVDPYATTVAPPETTPAATESAPETGSTEESAAPVSYRYTLPDTLDTSKKFTLKFWAKNDTNMTQVKIYQKAIEDFQALYPNITVELRRYNGYGKIYQDVITNIGTHTTPNICISYPDHIATYLSGEDVVVPLDGLLEDPRFGLGGSELKFDSPTKDEIVPEYLAECYVQDGIYALPYMRSSEALYINEDFVKKLGYEIPDVITWDWIWEVSEAAAATKGSDGTYSLNNQKTLLPFIYKSTDNMMIQMLHQKKAGYNAADGSIYIFNDTTRSLLFEIADHVKSGAFSTFKISSYPGNFFNAGQCIFAIDSTAGATWIGSEAPLTEIPADKVVHFNTVVRPIPQFDPEEPQMISQGPSVCLFWKDDPQEVLASWLFMQFLLTNSVQIAYSQTEGYVPVTTKAQQDPAYTDYLSRAGEDNSTYYDVKIKAAEMVLENIGNTFTTPVFNGSATLRESAGQMIENVATSIRRKQTVDDAYIDKLYSDMISLYHLDLYGTIKDEPEPVKEPETNEAGETAEVPATTAAEKETTAPSDPKDLGPLPAGARALLISLAAVWVLLGAAWLIGRIRAGKKKHA